MNWFRVPSWIGGRLSGDHVATDAEAWVDLLGRWYQGEDVSACAFVKATRWGKGRVLEFMPKVARWAVENGGTVPDSWSAKVADRPSDRKRTGLRTDADKVEPAETAQSGPETDRATDRKRTASCARVSSSLRREENEKREEEREKGETPVQTIHGSQATVVIPAEPVVESPLLSLLTSSGMAMGQAAGVARKLLEAGITSLDCPEIAALDEFDIGRIVGAQKGRVVAAFRRAGWVPPKERAQSTRVGPSAMPPVSKPRTSGGLSAAERVWQAANEVDESARSTG